MTVTTLQNLAMTVTALQNKVVTRDQRSKLEAGDESQDLSQPNSDEDTNAMSLFL